MSSTTTVRGLLCHFQYGVVPPATNQRASPPPVRLPTSLSLQAISAAGAGGGGTRGEASRRRSPRNSGGGGRGAGGGGGRHGGGATSGATGAATRKVAATKTTAARFFGRSHKPKVQVSSDRAGEEYRAEGSNQEESTDKSGKWGGADTEGLATEEEAKTAVWWGGG